MGWDARTVAGIATLSHDGSTFNAHANVVLIPKGKWGIVLLENAENSADEFFGSRRMSGIADGVTKMVKGREPGSTHTSPSVYVVFGFVFAVLALQVRGITRSVRTLGHWRTEPSQRPHGAWRITRTLVPPAALSLLWAYLVLVALPARSAISLTHSGWDCPTSRVCSWEAPRSRSCGALSRSLGPPGPSTPRPCSAPPQPNRGKESRHDRCASSPASSARGGWPFFRRSPEASTARRISLRVR